jgi:hypothetical protein
MACFGLFRGTGTLINPNVGGINALAWTSSNTYEALNLAWRGNTKSCGWADLTLSPGVSTTAPLRWRPPISTTLFSARSYSVRQWRVGFRILTFAKTW